MKTQTADFLPVFGVFLVFVGGIGYMTHPEKETGFLIAGLLFGALCVVWGLLGASGIRWSWSAGFGTIVLLAAGCVWRAVVNWTAVAEGDSERAFTAGLVTLTAAISALMLGLFLRNARTAS